MNLAESLITIIVSILASSGIWAIVQNRIESKDNRNKFLLGMGHEYIVALGLRYINRGWVSDDEYETLNDFLYQPYIELGGNGAAHKIMEEVNKLPIRSVSYMDFTTKNGKDNSK